MAGPATKPADCPSKSLAACLLPMAQHLSTAHPPLCLQVLCMHGGIGRSINSIEQIEELQRPLTMEDGGIVLMDLLWRWAQWDIHWMMLVHLPAQARMLAMGSEHDTGLPCYPTPSACSDPTTNDAVEGVQPSPRGPGLVTFGPDRVMEFCRVRRLAGQGGRGWSLCNLGACTNRAKCIDALSCLHASHPPLSPRLLQNNDLQMIVRAHECVMDGFERFAQGHLITLFRCGTSACAFVVASRSRFSPCVYLCAPTAPATAHNPSIASLPHPLAAPPTTAAPPTMRAPSWCWAATWSWCARCAARLAVACCCTDSPEAPFYLPCCPRTQAAPLCLHRTSPMSASLHSLLSTGAQADPPAAAFHAAHTRFAGRR